MRVYIESLLEVKTIVAVIRQDLQRELCVLDVFNLDSHELYRTSVRINK
jgi:hypothetical protein